MAGKETKKKKLKLAFNFDWIMTRKLFPNDFIIPNWTAGKIPRPNSAFSPDNGKNPAV